MNKVKNQSGEIIIAVGAEGSHIRNKETFNLTFEKLTQKLFEQWNIRQSDFGWMSYFELQQICMNDGLAMEDYNALIRTAVFYFKPIKVSFTTN